MHSLAAALIAWSTPSPLTGGAALFALATLWWGLQLLRHIRKLYDRILVGLVGAVATYQGLHLAFEPRGWAWIANALGVLLCLAAMAMLARLFKRNNNAEFALRLSEAREQTMRISKGLELATIKDPAAARAEVPRTILESAPMAMFAIGLDGSVNFWNAAAERVLGWSSQEVLGNHMPNLIAHSTGGVFDGGPIRLVRKDGAEIQGPVQSVPVRDARGAVSGILTIVTPNSL
ncbi:MAG TPA: PAS domain-containing protein [Bryobacteraceae bacterium]|jgi:PAS domain S-box-containing protein